MIRGHDTKENLDLPLWCCLLGCTLIAARLSLAESRFRLQISDNVTGNKTRETVVGYEKCNTFKFNSKTKLEIKWIIDRKLSEDKF